jgi:alpha-L-rhamnosidase
MFPPTGVAASLPHVTVTQLETDAASAPLGMDNPKPRLSWQLESGGRGVLQTAYEVFVAESATTAAAGNGDVWDSGVAQSSTPWVDYAGPALASRTRYYWAVRVWDEHHQPSAVSASSWFETAFMSPSEWTAMWIKSTLPACPAASSVVVIPSGSPSRNCPSPLLRTEFSVTKPVASARLYASGLGYGVYYVDGHRVGDEVLDPGFTDYLYRVFYVTHDVTSLIQQGQNVIGAELGRGYYSQVGSTYSGYSSAPWHAEPTLRAELIVTYTDGTTSEVDTSPSWKTIDGPRRGDDVILGETYDARRAVQLAGWSTPGFDDSTWSAAATSTGPAGTLVAQDQEPIRAFEHIPFQTVTQPATGVYLFDLGQNVVGNAILEADLAAGQTINLQYGEKLTNGRVDVSGGGQSGPIQLDTYTATAGRNVWRPEFSYKGFQYVEVTGLMSPPSPSMLTAEVWHSDVPSSGSWTSSNRLANLIVRNSTRAILSNYFSQPTDTPVYEKSGYTGDGQLMAPSDQYLFDTRRFAGKWSEDIRQNIFTSGPFAGQMAWVAPDPNADTSSTSTNGTQLLTPGWDAALFTVPDTIWRYYGDDRPALRALPEMKIYNQWIQGFAPGFTITGVQAPVIASLSRNGLGDWSPPTSEPSMGISIDSTAWYYDMEQILARVATDAGDATAATLASVTSTAINAAFNARFYDPASAAYEDTQGQNENPDPSTPPYGFSQHDNAIAMGLGLVPANEQQAVGDAVAKDVEARGLHLNTGIMGTRYLFDTLTQTGHIDDAWAVATQETYPSYGYWIDTEGYTSLGENWESNTRSHNHHMFGTILQWLFEDVAGYQPLQNGYAQIQFKPFVPSSGLDWVAASTDTVRGQVATRWQKAPTGFALDVTVPANATASVYFPGTDPTQISEIGLTPTLPAQDAPGVTLVGVQGDRVVYQVGSGTYKFRIGTVPSTDIPEAASTVVLLGTGGITGVLFVAAARRRRNRRSRGGS